MKKIIALTLSTVLLAMLMIMPVFAAYPSSPNHPAGLQIMMGELIGNDSGWPEDNPNPDTGRHAAFDGDEYTFYDAYSVGRGYAGVSLSEPYILREIRIYPRQDQLARFDGAMIIGMNDLVTWDEFDRDKGTVIWESMEPADPDMWYIIKEDQFNVKDQAFRYYVYYRDMDHCDVAEVELWGVTAASLAAPEPAPEAAPAPVEAAPAPVVAAPAPAPVAAPVAVPQTGVTSLAILGVIGAAVTFGAVRRRK